MKDTKKMVLLMWDKWEALLKDRNGQSQDNVDVGIQVSASDVDVVCFQGKDSCEANVQDSFNSKVSNADLPSPPVEFVKPFFEKGEGEDKQSVSVSVGKFSKKKRKGGDLKCVSLR